MGSGDSWFSGPDPSSRETQYLSVCCADCNRPYLVQVLPGHHTQELESLCSQLLCWFCRWIPALQDMETQPRAEGKGEGCTGLISILSEVHPDREASFQLVPQKPPPSSSISSGTQIICHGFRVQATPLSYATITLRNVYGF